MDYHPAAGSAVTQLHGGRRAGGVDYHRPAARWEGRREARLQEPAGQREAATRVCLLTLLAHHGRQTHARKQAMHATCPAVQASLARSSSRSALFTWRPRFATRCPTRRPVMRALTASQAQTRCGACCCCCCPAAAAGAAMLRPTPAQCQPAGPCSAPPCSLAAPADRVWLHLCHASLARLRPGLLRGLVPARLGLPVPSRGVDSRRHRLRRRHRGGHVCRAVRPAGRLGGADPGLGVPQPLLLLCPQGIHQRPGHGGQLDRGGELPPGWAGLASRAAARVPAALPARAASTSRAPWLPPASCSCAWC